MAENERDILEDIRDQEYKYGFTSDICLLYTSDAADD
mgnify:CR=1 FL=1